MASGKSKKNDAAGAANGGTDAGADPGAVKQRRPRNPEEQLYWDEQRNAVLLGLVLAEPGKYTSNQIAEVLAGHPAFADQAELLRNPVAAEKIRTQVKKLSKRAEGLRLPALALKRRGGVKGTALDAVIQAAYAQAQQRAQTLGQGPVPGFGGMAGFTAPAPLAAGAFSGGLVPTGG
ncbi:MAG TPA: hypothetical protein VIM84_05070 [Gemmatimonadales bacterium]